MSKFDNFEGEDNASGGEEKGDFGGDREERGNRGRGGESRGPGLCYQFQDTGKCEWGENCRFAPCCYDEDGNMRNPQRNSRKRGGFGDRGGRFGGRGGRSEPGLCYQFQDTGSCDYGENCRFAPCCFGEGGKGGDSGSDRRSGGGFKSRDRGFNRRSGGRREPGICYTFRDTGVCDYGENCRFAPCCFGEGGKGTGGGNGGGFKRRSNGGGREPGICYTFRDTGECKYGTRCKFAPCCFGEGGKGDGNFNSGGRGGGKSEPGICYQFEDTGTCEYGDRCKFAPCCYGKGGKGGKEDTVGLGDFQDQ
jgi:hypothetical protein